MIKKKLAKLTDALARDKDAEEPIDRYTKEEIWVALNAATTMLQQSINVLHAIYDLKCAHCAGHELAANALDMRIDEKKEFLVN